MIDQIGLPKFVDTLGAVLAPLYGILVADFYVVQRRSLLVADLYSMDPARRYHYVNGWNMRAIGAFAVAAVFSVATVWVPWLVELSGFAWVIGAAIGAVLYVAVMAGRTPGAVDRAIPVSPAPVAAAPATAETPGS